MAINVNFNGSTIYHPGAYSKVQIDLGGGFPLSPTGIVAIFGESEQGTPGANEVDIANNVFSPEQLPQIKQKYGSGNLTDACNFLFAPGSDGAIPGGAQAVYIYKTNNATRASFSPVLTNWGTIRAKVWGTNGNLLTWKNSIVPESAATHTGSVAITPSTADVGMGNVLTIAINGAAPVSYTIAASANVAALLVLLNTAFTGLTFTQNASNKIVITMSAASSQYSLGWGRSFEVFTATANSAFGFTAGEYDAVSEPMAALQIKDTNSLLVESENVGGEIAMLVGFRADANDATAATVSISSTTITLTVTGGAQAGVKTIDLAGYNALSQIVNAINILPRVNNHGWVAEAGSAVLSQISPAALDRVSSMGALSNTGELPGRIKRDADRVKNFFGLSASVDLVLGTGSYLGLPDAQVEVALTGGTLGATQTADITNALAKFEKIRVNSVVPLFSRDATADIADNLTDPTSNYTIDGIHQAVKTHLSLMSTTKRRSERQGYLSCKDTYVECKSKAGNIADFRCQLVIQDVKQGDSDGLLKWFQPWAGAALLAGARGGSPAGTPMTNKFFNMSGIRQTGQAMSTAEEDMVLDFDPDTQFDDAIQSGITFWEHPQTGGFKLVVDNTTYGKDGNWVYNRAHVLYAADIIAFDFRTQMENIYVGVKNTVSAAEIKSTASSILRTYLAQGLTVSTDDAKEGFKQLVVQINGNTVNISVVVKLVESIDFILNDITLQRATATA